MALLDLDSLFTGMSFDAASEASVNMLHKVDLGLQPAETIMFDHYYRVPD